MHKGRLEAFSDGVIAIIITIMVLEMKVPHDASPAALVPLVPVFFSYMLSFIYVGIYWNNHHHMLQASSHVSGAALWANLHLLFWMSLMPFVSGWMGENHFAQWPVFAYGVVLLMTAVAYVILTYTLLRTQPENSPLHRAVGKDRKGKISLAVYALALALNFVSPWLSCALYALVALMWLVPDSRIERVMRSVS